MANYPKCPHCGATGYEGGTETPCLCPRTVPDEPTFNRDTALALADSFRKLNDLEKQRRGLVAKGIRACVLQIQSSNSAKRREGLNGLLDIADVLDPKD